MSPLGRAIAGLREADARRATAVAEAAQAWNDAAFRALAGRVLDPLAAEARRFAGELDAADAELQRVHRLLDQR